MKNKSETYLSTMTQTGELISPPSKSFASITQLHLMSLKSKNSRKTLTSIFNNIARMFEAPDHLLFDWVSLKPADVDTVIEILSEKRKLRPTTVNSYISAIRALFKTGYVNGLIDHNTFHRMSYIKGVKSTRIIKNRAPTTEEVLKFLITHCESHESAMGTRDAAMISVLAGCGLRRAELTSITMDDYDKALRTFRVIGKGNKERMVPIPKSCMCKIESWINNYRGTSGAYLFCRVRRHDVVQSNSPKLSGNAVYDMLKKRTKECEKDHIRPHGLRRFCGTTLLKAGKDLVLVRDYLGHNSISTTQIYIENDKSELQEAAEVFSI
jgi:site-specific recombinase XerD